MNQDNFTYKVKCRQCHSVFNVQLFESHEKNLFLVDKKDWYCDRCKKEYFSKQTAKLTQAHQAIGFPELKGTVKMVSWAVKIRAELINKANYLRSSLTFSTDQEKELSDRAFEMFFKEWQEKTSAKWWIDSRKTTVRDISKRVEELSKSIQEE